ncbi:MAG: dockerin type I repeat-containing protein [Muribaculaceae bacterium]|nr:dockerin type I repeat-containing protein [Muribaculaceae bacterium]
MKKYYLVTLLLVLVMPNVSWAASAFTAEKLASINIEMDRDIQTGGTIGSNRVSMAYTGGTSRVTVSNYFAQGSDLTFSVNWGANTIQFLPQSVYTYQYEQYTCYLYVVAQSVVDNSNVNTVLNTTLSGRVNSSGFTISTTWNLALIYYDPDNDTYINAGAMYENGMFTQFIASNATMTYDEVDFDSSDHVYNTGDVASFPVYLYYYNNKVTIYNFLDYGFVPEFTPGEEKNTWVNPNQVLADYKDNQTGITYHFGLYNWEQNADGYADVLTNQDAQAVVTSETVFDMGNITLADPVRDGMGFIGGNAKIVLETGTLPFEELPIPGDVNADKKVNVTDVMCVANYIVGITPEVFVEEAADVNASGSINITDLIAIANIAVGNSSAPALMAPKAATNDVLSIGDYDPATCTIAINLENATPYAGFQMDVTLPQGLTLEGAELTGRAASHTLMTGVNPDGSIRLLGFSIDNDEIATGSDAIITLKVKANASLDAYENIIISDIFFTQSNEVESVLPNVTAGAPVVTAISQVGNDSQSVDVYDMKGVLLRQDVNPAEATKGLPTGVYIINGKKVLVK